MTSILLYGLLAAGANVVGGLVLVKSGVHRWGERFLKYLVALGAPDAVASTVSEPAMAAGLIAAVVAALVAGAILVAHTVREADRQREVAERAAASGLRWLQALAQVSLSLSQPIDRNRFLRQITEALASLTSAHNVVLWELDGPAGLLVRRAWTADPSIGTMELPASLTLQQGGTGWIARHREPLFVEDISRDVRIMAADWALSRDLVAFAGAPVAVGGELLGVLTLNLKRGRLPEGNDRELLQSFAAQAAVAMNNARLFADNARLYEEARQRLHALQETQAQLLQAAKLSAVGKLVSGVTHELNNPLSVVIGYGQLLLSRGVPDEIRRPLELMIAQGERMAKIVQGLMLFSRQRKPERRAMDVREVIDPVLVLRDNQLALSSIRLETDFGVDVPPNATQKLRNATGSCVEKWRWPNTTPCAFGVVASCAKARPGIADSSSATTTNLMIIALRIG
jgi:signal transduction histidine kinase